MQPCLGGSKIFFGWGPKFLFEHRPENNSMSNTFISYKNMSITFQSPKNFKKLKKTMKVRGVGGPCTLIIISPQFLSMSRASWGHQRMLSIMFWSHSLFWSLLFTADVEWSSGVFLCVYLHSYKEGNNSKMHVLESIQVIKMWVFLLLINLNKSCCC